MLKQQVFKQAFAGAILTKRRYAIAQPLLWGIATTANLAILLAIPKASQAADLTPSSENALQIAQAIPSNVRSLSVTGNGISSVPADQAAIVISYALNYYPEVPSEPGGALALPPAVQESDLKMVTDALVSAGVPADNISYTPEAYSFQALRLTVRVNNPTRERVNALVDLANNTAMKDSKFIASTSGVVYVARNCQSAETAARQAAMADARSQATALADTANVKIGDLVSVSSNPNWNYAGPFPTSCPTSLDEALRYNGSYTPQTYDPSQPSEVPVGVSISLTYAME